MALAFVLAAAAMAYLANERVERAARRSEAIELSKHGSPSKALEALGAFLEVEPTDPELLEAIVLANHRAGKPHEEIEPFSRKWFECDPHRIASAEAHLRTLQALNRPAAEVIPVLERCLALDPRASVRHEELASLYYIVGRYEDAIREARTLLQMPNSDQVQVRIAIAQAEFARGNNSAAIAELDLVRQTEAERPEALLLRARVHQKLGEDHLAVPILQNLQPRDHAERILVLNLLGQSLVRLGRPDQAQAAFDQLSRLQEAIHHMGDAKQKPGDWAYQRRAAEALLKAGLPRDAATLLSDALLRIGFDRAGLHLLAECHDRLGEPQRARDARADADRPR
ncbi:MAG: tetratricopeptide repeat protein [Gemmataceae bacterium]